MIFIRSHKLDSCISMLEKSLFLFFPLNSISRFGEIKVLHIMTFPVISTIILYIYILINVMICCRQSEIFNVIKEIVFCRPCIDIIQELIHLLSKISMYTEITDSLCQLSCK